MSYTYAEGFKNNAGDTWACTNSLATKSGALYVYSGALTSEQVNSPDFNITAQFTAGNDGATVDISKLRVKIVYTIPLTSSTQTGRGASGFSDVAYGSGNTIVICGASGLIQQSTDNGVTWNSVPSGVSANLRHITWSGSQFVVVGDAGTILTSSDGSAWSPQVSGVTSSIMGIARIPGGGFLVVGAQDIDRTSPHGVDWR